MTNSLLSPLSDDVFKTIFADRRNIDNLAAFLRPVVRLPEEEFSRLSLVDPSLKRLFKRDKQGILDVKVLTKSGKVINQPRRKQRGMVVLIRYLTQGTYP